MNNKVKITFVLPDSLKKDLMAQIIKDGYNMRGKSRWVSEAIEQLFAIHDYPDLVKLNDEMSGFERLESVLVSKELKQRVDNEIITVRKKYLTIDGVQSRILRTAIVQRLLRS